MLSEASTRRQCIRMNTRSVQVGATAGPWGVSAETSALALDGAGGETGDVVLHEERVDEGDGNGAQQGPRHQLAPVEGVPADQLAHDAYRHGAHARFAEEEQRVEKLVLRQRKGEDPGGNEAGHAEGKNHPGHGAKAAGAVDQRL